MPAGGTLKPGDSAPSFSFTQADGKTLDVGVLKGRPYLVYFYPKDNTPGCVKEACTIRDKWEDFKKAGLLVIGVSFDSEKSHAGFRERFRLPFGLAADKDREIAKAFGVWHPDNLRDKLLPFARRMSFLVGNDQKIVKVYEKVDPSKHAEEVLKDAEELQLQCLKPNP